MNVTQTSFLSFTKTCDNMCDMTEDDFEVPIKGVIVGNGAVGKSSMIQVSK